MQHYRDPAQGGSAAKLKAYMKSPMFRDAVQAAYLESKGVLEEDMSSASLRGFTNHFVDTDFALDDPMSLEYLQLRIRMMEMISRFQVGGFEDELAAYTRLTQTDFDASVGSTTAHSVLSCVMGTQLNCIAAFL